MLEVITSNRKENKKRKVWKINGIFSETREKIRWEWETVVVGMENDEKLRQEYRETVRGRAGEQTTNLKERISSGRVIKSESQQTYPQPCLSFSPLYFHPLVSSPFSPFLSIHLTFLFPEKLFYFFKSSQKNQVTASRQWVNRQKSFQPASKKRKWKWLAINKRHKFNLREGKKCKNRTDESWRITLRGSNLCCSVHLLPSTERSDEQEESAVSPTAHQISLSQQ